MSEIIVRRKIKIYKDGKIHIPKEVIDALNIETDREYWMTVISGTIKIEVIK